MNYSWFDFEIQDELPGFGALLLPNTPEHAASAGVNYDRKPLAVGVFVRWVDAFRWGVGPFQGPVQPYRLLSRPFTSSSQFATTLTRTKPSALGGFLTSTNRPSFATS